MRENVESVVEAYLGAYGKLPNGPVVKEIDSYSQQENNRKFVELIK